MKYWSVEHITAAMTINNLVNLAQPWLIAIGINAFLLGGAWFLPKKLLTPAGFWNAGLLGVIIWAGLGWRAYVVMVAYFIVGSGVTQIGMAAKAAAGIAEKRAGARGPENVWGSALVAAVCAIVVYGVTMTELPHRWVDLFTLAYVASMATKLSDTSASEVGKAYGKTTYLITTLQPVAKGTEGAISLEGTVAGMVGSLLLGSIAFGLGLLNISGLIICLIAAFIATNMESLIGATIQEKFDWLTNELVNVINTLIGAILSLGLGWLITQT
jgi:uncharacterized protein (TIGR00297 family)